MPKVQFDYKITVGTLIQLAVILAGFIYGYATLGTSVATSARAVDLIPSIQRTVEASADAIKVLQDQTSDISKLNTRVTNLETRSSVLGPQRDQFQRDAQQTFREINATLSVLQQNDSRILQQLADLKGQTP